MYRQKTVFVIIFLVLIAGFSFASDLTLGPYLQLVNPAEILVVWETNEATIGSVTYGFHPDSQISKITESIPAKIHLLTLSRLQANQTYFYRCSWDRQSSPIYHFKTDPREKKIPIRAAVVGDSRGNPEVFSQIVRQIINYKPDFVIHTGDLVVDGRKLDQWKPQFFDPMQPLLATTPLFIVPGNHENESQFYYDHFPIHAQKPYWSLDYGSVHLIGLNSNVDGKPSSAQYQWLVDDLKANEDKTWRFAMFHHPLFHGHPTRAVYDIRYYWQPLFIKYQVQFAFSGHDHYYLRTFPIGNMSDPQQGVIHISSAGGGAPLYQIIPKSYSADYRSVYHFVILDISEDEIIGRAITAEGKCFDTFIFNREQSFSGANFVEYEMFELEQRLNYALANVTPISIQNQELLFDTNIVLKPDFKYRVKGYYHWETPSDWFFTPPKKAEFSINPGEPIIIPVNAKVLASKMFPSPNLKLHLEANAEPNYIGFRNQDIQVSLDQAALSKALNSSLENLDPIFDYFAYFSNSGSANLVNNQLAQIAIDKSDNRILDHVQQFLMNHPTPENKYRFYVYEFLSGDFSHWNEWLEIARRLSSSEIEIPSRLMERIAGQEELNAHFIKQWWLVGPFHNLKNDGLATIFPPEKKINLSKAIPGPNGERFAWRERSAGAKGYLDLLIEFSPNQNVVAYAHTMIEANQDGQVLLLLGSDDGAAVWLNQKELFRKNVGRTARPCQDIILAPVKKGKNELLVKVAQGTGDWGLYLQILDREQIVTKFWE